MENDTKGKAVGKKDVDKLRRDLKTRALIFAGMIAQSELIQEGTLSGPIDPNDLLSSIAPQPKVSQK